MILLALVFAACLFLSAFFAGAEMAFVSANILRVRERADAGDSGARKIMKLQEFPQQFLALLLIGNNVVNITATAIVTYWLEKQFGIANEWLVTALMFPLLIIFCETVPKDYCRIKSQNFLLKYAGLLAFLMRIGSYPVAILLKGIDWILGPFGEAVDRSIFVSEKEFRLLIEESVRTGILEPHEKKLVDTIMDFERIAVESVMIPLARAPKVEITETVGIVKDLARKTQAKMILVYEEIPSIVVGMIYTFDLLFEEKDSEPLRLYLRSPIFLHRSTSIEKAFLTLQEKRQSFAVVTDDLGEVTGVVPIEKLFALS